VARREMKYVVFQEEDVETYLTPEQKEKFEEIRATIFMGRKEDRKAPNNYVVVNMMEPYAEPFWDIIVAFESERGKRTGVD
jgi:hypothetical protein